MSDPVTRLNAALAGRYKIERELGEGGMATVYLADDLKHERKVALKVLKPDLAAVVGAERFLAEIKTTANLQHPHILPLFDSGEADSFLFYVMPYVEGESLQARIDRENQLPVDDAVRIATEVADALDYAHRQGVIHRDVKPGNILLQEGRVLITDFGIALAVGAAGGNRLTQTGFSVGTPTYMSPEQATGDQRVGPPTDIYASSCVLYEMLVGEPPYPGRSVQAVLGRIIAGEPVSATDERPSVPRNVDAAIRKALEKLPADRFVSAGHFAKALTDPAFTHGEAEEVSRRPWKPLSVGSAVVALALAGWLIAVGVGEGGFAGRSSAPGTGQPRGARTVGFRIAGDYSNILSRAVAISPDGAHMAHSTTRTPFVLRSLDRSDISVELPGGGSGPFFSPNGEWIGFFQFETLRRVSITGGAASTVATIDGRSLGASWGSNDTIVYATTLGLYRVSAEGGEPPELLAAPNTQDGEQFYGWPDVLPGGRAVLFTIVPQGSESDAEAIIAVLDMASREITILLRGGGGARYASTGHLIYSNGGRLHAVAFDSSARELRSESVPLSIEGVQLIRGAVADFDVSADGTLVYVPADAPLRTLVWVDRNGTVEPLGVPPQGYVYPRISRDGSKVLVDFFLDGRRDIYTWDIGRKNLSRLTTNPTEDLFAHWSLDGQRVFFSSDRDGTISIFSRAADGTGQAILFFETESNQMLAGLTPDGERLLAAQVRQGASDLDIVSLTLEAPVQVETLLSTPYRENNPALSPDGLWLAYQSDASGQVEVYVGPFPDLGSGERRKISNDGGQHPLWAPSGDELFFRATTGELMTVAVELTPDFRLGEVTEVFPQGGPSPMAFGGRGYDVSPIDGRFLMTQPLEPAEDKGIMVVINWFQELTERVPAP